jgi:hemolysin III
VATASDALVPLEGSADDLPARPAWRGRLHSWTFFLAIPGGIALILSADRAAARTAASIYAASVLIVFGTSAAYHRIARSTRARRIMRRLDHAMIFVLIAGTYTPVCLLALPAAWGIPVLATVATGAVAGVTLKLAAFDRLKWLAYALYPILGWAAVVAIPVLATRVSVVVLSLIVLGGVVYSAGLPVLLRHRPDPWPTTFGYHEVWHACTVVAGGCHFAAVGLLVAR